MPTTYNTDFYKGFYDGSNPCKETLLDHKGSCQLGKGRLTVLVEFAGNFGKTNKKYAFNLVSYHSTSLSAVQVGTVISTKAYSSDMVVVGILDNVFEYVNRNNGDLKNTINNTNDFKLVEINLDKLSKIVSFVEEV